MGNGICLRVKDEDVYDSTTESSSSSSLSSNSNSTPKSPSSSYTNSPNSLNSYSLRNISKDIDSLTIPLYRSRSMSRLPRCPALDLTKLRVSKTPRLSVTPPTPRNRRRSPSMMIKEKVCTICKIPVNCTIIEFFKNEGMCENCRSE